MDAYTELSESLDRVINERDGAWRDRAERVLAACDNGQLAEFLGWFEINDDDAVVVAS